MLTRIFCFNTALGIGTSFSASDFLQRQHTEEAHMPAIFIPVLWVGGAAILLGGGWYVITHMAH